MEVEARQSGYRRLAWGGFWLGLALGGFFDGILLHQVLQWHHLLAGVAPTETAQDLRFQVLADGLFHVAHYIFAALGLWLIWKSRRCLDGGGRRLVAWSLIGFGTWHSFDAVVAHWTLQLHRIRMDVENPLLWDLGWLILFGVLVLAAGVKMLRTKPPNGPDSHDSRGKGVAVALTLGAVTAGALAALPPSDLVADGKTLVVFRPGMSFSDIVAAADAVDGRLIWTDKSEAVWLMALGPDARPSRLYLHGALLVGNGPVAAGCLSWSRV